MNPSDVVSATDQDGRVLDVLYVGVEDGQRIFRHAVTATSPEFQARLAAIGFCPHGMRGPHHQCPGATPKETLR